MDKTIKIDVNTSNVQRGKFARVAVNIDLAKPLLSKIWLDGSWQRIEYEGLPQICFSCGRVGHSSVTCPQKRDGSAKREGEMGPIWCRKKAALSRNLDHGTSRRVPKTGVTSGGHKERNSNSYGTRYGVLPEVEDP